MVPPVEAVPALHCVQIPFAESNPLPLGHVVHLPFVLSQLEHEDEQTSHLVDVPPVEYVIEPHSIQL